MSFWTSELNENAVVKELGPEFEQLRRDLAEYYRVGGPLTAEIRSKIIRSKEIRGQLKKLGYFGDYRRY